VLVQGTGTGWDVISWARLRPRKIIATDMFPFEDSWEDITWYCIELKLFSYLTTRQYIDIYQEAHFVVKGLILEISPDALRFKK